MRNIKQYFFKEKRTIDRSEYEAEEIIKSSPKKLKMTLQYEKARCDVWVLYQTNKKTRTKNQVKIRRCLALLARKYDGLVAYDEKENVALINDKTFIFADRVNSKKELEYHYKKHPYLKNKKVISIVPSKYASSIRLDTQSIKEYYKNYSFPEWFKPFIKMRHFRTMDNKMRFLFSTRRYNDTSKWKAEDKFKNDMLKLKEIGKCYFSIARMLDSKIEAEGKGFPLSNLMYFVLDIDGKCDGVHLIDNKGVCIKCLKVAKQKLKQTKRRIKLIPEIKVEKVLFSGTKGFHLHMSLNGKREISEKQMLKTTSKINVKKELVDTFVFEREGKIKFDSHRIMKVPLSVDSTTACIVTEKIVRIPVVDKIENFK